ncbi:MAG: hypothetical protein K6G19_06095, partial [Lachnospiraceae bacterium]|nr:hypothetical protein [Lachnospiraceae bacterium]
KSAFDKNMKMCLNDALFENSHALSRELFCHTSDNVCFDYEQSKKLFHTFFNDPETDKAIWRVKQGYIKEIINKVCNEIEKLYPNRDIIDDDIFDDFLNRIEEKIVVYSADKSQCNFNWRATIHEIGHAVVGNKISSPKSGVWDSITCEKNASMGWDGACEESSDYDKLISTDEENIVMLCAGRVAEEMYFETLCAKWYDDFVRCRHYAFNMIIDKYNLDYDASERKLLFRHENKTYIAEDVLDRIIQDLMEKTKSLLADEKEHIEELAKRLNKARTIDGATFDQWYKEICE